MIDTSGDIVYFVIITGRKQKDALLTALLKTSAKVVNIVYGKGSVNAGYLLDMLGFVPEEQKVMITCLMARERSDAALSMLCDEFSFNKPNTGIAFTIPIETL